MERLSRDEALRRARTLLGKCAAGVSLAERARFATDLAALIALATREDERVLDRARRGLLARLCSDDAGQAFVSAVADRVHRSKASSRSAETLRALLEALGNPRFLPAVLRAPLGLVQAGVVPDEVTVAGFREGVHLGAKGLVHPAEASAIGALVTERRAEQTTVNVNLVGEVVLGEREAALRAEAYRALITRGTASAVSIKLSSIASQISLSAFDASIAMLTPRLLALYRAARAKSPHVLVNLDMEAFDDLELTFELHARLSNEPSISDLTTGVVLQAYLPDVHARYEALLALAKARVSRGWAPLRVRIVKGANLAMERHLAALRGHPLPIYPSKLATDASWLALVERALRKENARALRVGVASHNLFDLSYALATREANHASAHVELEMLEGMADAERRTFATLSGAMLVYAPIVEDEGFDAAIAYLVRRLEEATTRGHFLRESFAMEPFDARYVQARDAHTRALTRRETLETTSLRALPRRITRSALDAPFRNSPDTDWAVQAQRRPLLEALARRREASPSTAASIVGGEVRGGKHVHGRDPSRPGFAAYAIELGDEHTLERALDTSSGARFSDVPARERAERLLDVAFALERARPELVATMVLDGGKRIVEADAEVSEAIDFAEHYARTAFALAEDRRVRTAPLGTVLVASPWNFPLAIGAGGVFGALAMGNSVLLKPSPKTPLVAYDFVRLAHEAGIPKDALALLVIDDALAGRAVLDPRVHAVVLTGSTRTAHTIRALRPTLPLFAETGGKNGMIVTALADRDLAIRDAVLSAFGHAGQKCSATSLLVCEREVYEDRGFRERLVDAAQSLQTGSAWDTASVVTPLIEPPTGPLARALDTLEPGESWLLAPTRSAENPALVTPSIKLDVRPGSFTHRTELFGPVLAMMHAEDLDEAIRVVNATPYGLTGGLQSLDPREQSRWLAQIEVGNAYVNRGTTGAIVRRQPFGGTKASCFGPGSKAGGASYVRQLVHVTRGEAPFRSTTPLHAVRALLDVIEPHVSPAQHAALQTFAEQARAVFEDAFSMPTDEAGLPTQRNLVRHLPRRSVALVLFGEDTPHDALRALVAARTAGLTPQIAFVGFGQRPFMHALRAHVTLLPSGDDEDALVARLRSVQERSFVLLRTHTDGVERALARAEKNVLRLRADATPHDAVALWLEEQSTTLEDHRYGQPLPEALRAVVPPAR